MMTFLDLKNAFSSVTHGMMFDMLEAVKVPMSVVHYIQFFLLQATWETEPIPM